MPGSYSAFEALVNRPGGIDQAYYDSLPEYLRNNLVFQQGGSEGAPDSYTVNADFRNSQGQQVVRTNPDGTVNMNGARLRDPSLLTQDEDLGTTTPAENLDQSEWEAAHRRRGQIAMAIMAAGTLAGGMGLLPGTGLGQAGGAAALGSGGGGTAMGLGEMGAEGFLGLGGAGGSGLPGGVAGYGSAGLTGGALAIPEAIPAVDLSLTIPEMASLPSLGGGLSVSQLLNGARQLLSGGQGQGGQIGLMGGGQAPQIGQHRENNDVYGLQASGLGPWNPFTEKKKPTQEEVAKALLAQNAFPNWG